MKKKKMILAVALSAALVLPMAYAASADENEMTEYTNAGMILPVPSEYDDLLLITMPEDSSKLFSVSEKASVEAARAHGYEEEEGLGFLFSIEKTDEESVHEMLCNDMSGVEVFAEGEDGTYYLFCHPTDVRVEFADDADRDEAMKQWSMLNEWAGGRMKEDFIEANAGLAEVFYGNTELDIVLAKIAYEDFKDYTISTLEFGPMEPKDVDPAPFLDRLAGMKLAYTEEEFPDGEYAVLTLPEENQRFDFSFAEGSENYIRQVITYDDGEEMEVVFKAEFPDAGTKASAVMEDWYHALSEAGGK